MRLQHHISKAAILLRSALFKVQVSEAYKAIVRAWTSLTLVVLVIPLPAQILDMFVIAERAIANRCPISWLQPPSLVIRNPRKLNLETDSTSLPSIIRGSSTLSGPMAMIFVLLTLRHIRPIVYMQKYQVCLLQKDKKERMYKCSKERRGEERRGEERRGEERRGEERRGEERRGEERRGEERRGEERRGEERRGEERRGEERRGDGDGEERRGEERRGEERRGEERRGEERRGEERRGEERRGEERREERRGEERRGEERRGEERRGEERRGEERRGRGRDLNRFKLAEGHMQYMWA